LSRATDKESVLAQVVRELEQITDFREQSNLVAATSILAGLQLNEQTIQQLMRSPVMRESTMYQAILREGRAEGLEQGRTAEGKALVLKLLTRKLGSLSPELTAKVSDLSLERLETLAEALLDFNSAADLESWLG
jgi:predicted transposase YdaD